MKNSEKLRMWQDRFYKSKSAYESVLTRMEDRQNQYRGDAKLKNSGQKDEPKETCHVWNITAENIDSEIDSVIPPVKVTALRKEDEHLAKKIEQMITAQMDRMPVEELNDITERTVKVQGGVIFLPEWDNGRRTHTTVGEVVLSHVHPKQFIPQNGVNNIDDMDYYFLMLPQTKESSRRRYGVEVHDEAEEFPEARSFEADTADDMVTLIIVHYRNDHGFVGQFGWVGDTVVFDYEDCMARVFKKCSKCGQVQDGTEVALDRPLGKDGGFPQGAGRRKDGKCAFCGGKLENATKDTFRAHLSDLPALGMPENVVTMLTERAKRATDGEYLPPLMVGAQVGGLPKNMTDTARRVPTGAMMDAPGAMMGADMGASGMPRGTGTMMGAPGAMMEVHGAGMAEVSTPYGAMGAEVLTPYGAMGAEVMPFGVMDEEIEIPYFKPESYPAVLQRNITTFGEFLGESDCDKISYQQNTVNRLSHKIIGRVLDAGSTVGLPSDTTITTDRTDRKIWRFKSAADIQMVKQFDFTGDIAPHLAVMSQVYEESRRVLGITDSFQGRRDTTATSGEAKKFAAAQSAGRLESKKVLKSACWQRIYKRIFELMLAYCGERRPLATKQTDGSNLYGEWNSWEFLQVDAAGEIYWNTDFLFSTDDASNLVQNRMALWQEATSHLTSGAFGNPGEVQTLILFWEEMAANHYPGAETIAAQLKERAQQQAQAAQMQMTMQQQAQVPTQQMPTV